DLRRRAPSSRRNADGGELRRGAGDGARGRSPSGFGEPRAPPRMAGGEGEPVGSGHRKARRRGTALGRGGAASASASSGPGALRRSLRPRPFPLHGGPALDPLAGPGGALHTALFPRRFATRGPSRRRVRRGVAGGGGARRADLALSRL